MTANELLALLAKTKPITRGHLSDLRNRLNLKRGVHFNFDDRGRYIYTKVGVDAIVNRKDGRRKRKVKDGRLEIV